MYLIQPVFLVSNSQSRLGIRYMKIRGSGGQGINALLKITEQNFYYFNMKCFRDFFLLREG